MAAASPRSFRPWKTIGRTTDSKNSVYGQYTLCLKKSM